MGKKKPQQSKTPGELLVCSNPKAAQRYEVLEKLECGLVLMGSEVKSLRARRADLEGAYATVEHDEMFLRNMHIAPYEQAGAFGHEPKRVRKLLAHRRQVERLRGKLAQKGLTLVPLRVYFKEGRAKVELGLGRGKRVGDDREEIKRKIDMREAKQAMERRRP